MPHAIAFASPLLHGDRRLPARIMLLLAIAVALLLAGCSRNGAGEAGKAAAPGAQPGAAAGAPPALPVHIVQVEPRSVPIEFEVVGQVEGSKEVEVRARVYGTLQKQDYREGDPVRAGQLMFEIDPAPYEIALAQAKAVLAQGQAKLAQARRDETRLKPLAADRAVSQKEYDDAIAAAQTNEGALQQAQANVREAELNLSYTKVRAPVAGISGRALKSIGSLVTTDAAGSLLTTINQVTPVYVRFSLAPTDLARIPGGRIAPGTPVQVSIVLPDGSVYPQKGRLNFAATAIDPTIGTQQLRAEFDNPKQALLPGQFVRVRITAGERSNVFLVPQDAVLQTEKGSLVFVVGPDGKAMARPVEPGVWFGTEWEILQGLRAGDRVIVDNLLKVRPGVPVTPAPASPAQSAPGARSDVTPNTGNNPSPGQGEPAANATRAATEHPSTGTAK
jgi:membrane fusion protein, multidrug efflux system